MQAFRGMLLIAACAASLPVQAADRYLLAEDSASTTTWKVELRVAGDGTLEFQPAVGSAKPVTHSIRLDAAFDFIERRLEAAGRDEAAWRALRQYETARSEVHVGDRPTVPQLRAERRRLVVRADRAGLLPYSPDGPLTSQEVELLPSLGDPMLVAALLPGREVVIGETWNPAPWVCPAIAGTEVSFNSAVTCRLERVEAGVATISIEGTVSGAAKGATSETKLSGTLQFDVERKSVVAAKLTQAEKRSVGPVAPGMTLNLTAELQRSPAPSNLPADVIAGIPLEPSVESLRIEHPLLFGARLVCDRDWTAFQSSSRLLVLRLLDHGGIVAQCNVAPAPKVAAGERTPERQFQEDVVKALGDKLSKVVSADEVLGPGKNRIYRVTAVGTSEGTEMAWRYYLVSAPDGQQAAFAFTAEVSQLARLGDRDLALVSSLEFLPPPTPAKASPKVQ